MTREFLLVLDVCMIYVQLYKCDACGDTVDELYLTTSVLITGRVLDMAVCDTCYNKIKENEEERYNVNL